jgi:hypothetical protein
MSLVFNTAITPPSEVAAIFSKNEKMPDWLRKVINFFHSIWRFLTCNLLVSNKNLPIDTGLKLSSRACLNETETLRVADIKLKQSEGLQTIVNSGRFDFRKKEQSNEMNEESGVSFREQSNSLLAVLKQGANGLHGGNNDFLLPRFLRKELSDQEKKRKALPFLLSFAGIDKSLNKCKKTENRLDIESVVFFQSKGMSEEERFLSTISRHLNPEIESIFRALLSLYEDGVITNFRFDHITGGIELSLKRAIKVHVPKKEGDETFDGVVISFGPLVKMRIDNSKKKLIFDEGFSLVCKVNLGFFWKEISPEISFIEYLDKNHVNLCATYLFKTETKTQKISELTKLWADKSKIRQ